MKALTSFALSLVALGLFASGALAGNCSTTTNVSRNELFAAAVGPWSGPTGNEQAQFSGSANCPDVDLSETHALAAALSVPVWLETGENFAISGGMGFSDGEGAFGATGLMRFDRNVSGFAGGALVDDDTWAGKAGVRVGW
jgi:hypothetical protein